MEDRNYIDFISSPYVQVEYLSYKEIEDKYGLTKEEVNNKIRNQINKLIMVKSYQKKNVVIQAVQVTRENIEMLSHILNKEGAEVYFSNGNMSSDDFHLIIKTLEGDMKANVGDYIIKGIKGEFYPCKPDIFRETYEAPSLFIDPTIDLSTEKNQIIANKQLRKDLDSNLQNLKKCPGSRERNLAITKLQEAIMWLGMDLKRLNESNPYPDSYNPENTDIAPTADDLKL